MNAWPGSCATYFPGKEALGSAAIETLGTAWTDRLFRDVVVEVVATGEFVVVDVDTTLHCLHAAMTQASVWYSGLREAALDAAVDRLADTLMMLVGKGPAGR